MDSYLKIILLTLSTFSIAKGQINIKPFILEVEGGENVIFGNKNILGQEVIALKQQHKNK